VVYVVPDGAESDAVVAAGAPVLFVHRDEVPAETLTEIRRLGASRVVIVGGTARVDDMVERTLRPALAPVAVERVSGPERYETSRQLGQIRLGTGTGTVFIASGLVTSDSFAAAAAAHRVSAALMLARPDCLPEPTREVISGRDTVVVGGSVALSDVVLSGIACGRLAGAGQWCHHRRRGPESQHRYGGGETGHFARVPGSSTGSGASRFGHTG
jgi:N-acetylmuramoyl-L-alanine amidase